MKKQKETKVRTCVSCRKKSQKDNFLRFGEGRGAYVCKDGDCLARAIKANLISRGLKRKFSLEKIEEYAKKERSKDTNQKSSNCNHNGSC